MMNFIIVKIHSANIEMLLQHADVWWQRDRKLRELLSETSHDCVQMFKFYSKPCLKLTLMS